MMLSGIAARPRGTAGNLFFVAPPSCKPVDYAGLFAARDGRDGMVILRMPIAFARSRVSWEIGFEQNMQRGH